MLLNANHLRCLRCRLNGSILPFSSLIRFDVMPASSRTLLCLPYSSRSCSSFMKSSYGGLFQKANIASCSFCFSNSPDEKRIFKTLQQLLNERDGFEWHHFRVGSYNAVVQKGVQLRFEDDVMAVVILNTPSFFDTTYKKWLLKQYEVDESIEHFAKKIGPHPIRSFFLSRFADIEDKLLPIRAVSICDFEPLYDRLPLISLPACGHVSGAAYFYRVKEAIDPNTGKKKLHMGLSLHPKYGGHFSFRGVIVFPDMHLPATYKERPPLKTLETEDQVEEALQLFNERFFDNRYRNCGNPIERYSDLQLKYFNTPPEKRWSIIAHWFRP